MMDKKNDTFKLLHHQNADFISGVVSQPTDEQEICKHIASNLGVLYPYSVRKLVFYGFVAIMFSFFFGFTGCFTIFAVLSNFELDFVYIFVLLMSGFMLLIALVVMYACVCMLRAPRNIVDETYKSMVEQHNIIHGKVDSIETFRNGAKIYYQIENSDKLYTYITHHLGIVSLELTSRLYILYLNDNIHVEL